MKVMEKMEDAYEKKDEAYFVKVLKTEPSLVLRVHAVCILAEVGGENSIETLADVLLHDADPLVRHEAAFSLGQMGLSGANGPLERAVMTDPEAIVRHEAAAALGSIGNPATEKVPSDSGTLASMSETCFPIAVVYSRDAPDGAWITMMKYP